MDTSRCVVARISSAGIVIVAVHSVEGASDSGIARRERTGVGGAAGDVSVHASRRRVASIVGASVVIVTGDGSVDASGSIAARIDCTGVVVVTDDGSEDTSSSVVARIQGAGTVIVASHRRIHAAYLGVTRLGCAGIVIGAIHWSGVATSNRVAPRKIASVSRASIVSEYTPSGIAAGIGGAYIVVIANYGGVKASSNVVTAAVVTHAANRTVDRGMLARNSRRY